MDDSVTEVANPVFNPVVAWSLAQTMEDQNVVVFSLVGEDGATATAILVDPAYIAVVSDMLAEAAVFLDRANKEGWETVFAEVDEMGSEESPPDDISGLEGM